MKPTVTWIILTNAQTARVISNSGPNKGLTEVEGAEWHAPPLPEYSDEAGISQSSGGPGRASLTRPDTKHLAEQQFARVIARDIATHLRHGHFDRLLIVGAPHMLGSLRKALPPEVQQVVIAEVAKDLIQVSLADMPPHLAERLAI